MSERYVLIGLSQARVPWFTDLAGWATSGAVPAEFVKALSVEEVRARLRSGRRYSAVLVDGSVVGWDRDAAALASEQGCTVIAVDGDPPRRRGGMIGADASLPRGFDRERLVGVLRASAQPVPRYDEVTGSDEAGREPRPVGPADAGNAVPELAWRGRVVAVTGAGGTGRSTLAMALASGLSIDPRDRGSVLLADLALHAHQGLLHDAGDVTPGLVELVEAHRRGRLDPVGVRSVCFQVGDGAYDLLLGLRRHRDWAALRRHATATALEAIRSAYRLVVADVDADVEGEAESGLVEIEERNHLARVTLSEADLVLVVGRPGLAGLHCQLRVLSDLHRLGVAGERMLVVVNQARRSPRRRAEVAGALARMLADVAPGLALQASPIFIAERRGLDDVVADGGQIPPAISAPLVRATRAALDRAGVRLGESTGRADPVGGVPVAVAPGSLGRWTERTGEQTL